MNNIEKAYAITNAKIQFVSLVDKAANLREFLIVKQEGQNASFHSSGPIIKHDKDRHYITGIVYEPNTEDAHGNYMTEDEITKAAYAYAKGGAKVDLQHTFEEAEGAAVVESYVTKCDMEIEGVPIKKGTWLMTVEVSNPEVYEAIEKGQITGFSMGGVGTYSTTDDPLPVQKEEDEPPKGFWNYIKKKLGIEKGLFSDRYNKSMKEDAFWTAFNTLQGVLFRRDWASDGLEFVADEATIREACQEFQTALEAALLSPEPITKTLLMSPVTKAGKAMSDKNREALQTIYNDLGTFLGKFTNTEQEESEMTATEMKELAKALKQELFPDNQQNGTGTQPVEKQANPAPAPATTAAHASDDLDARIDAAVAKAMQKYAPAQPTTPAAPTADDLDARIEAAIAKAYGVSHQLDSEAQPQTVTKSQKDAAYYSLFS